MVLGIPKTTIRKILTAKKCVCDKGSFHLFISHIIIIIFVNTNFSNFADKRCIHIFFFHYNLLQHICSIV